MEGTRGEIDQLYRERGEKFTQLREGCVVRSRRMGRVRLVTFLAIIAPLIWPLPESGFFSLWRVALSLAFLSLFLAVVIYHQKLNRQSDWYLELSNLNEEGRNRLAGDWDALPEPGPRPTELEPPFAADLDVFGHASLFSLLGTAGTPGGRTLLGDGLLNPPSQLLDRQAAVAELAPLIDFREELTVRGRLMAAVAPEGMEEFLAWSEGEPWLAQRRWLIWVARLMPLIVVPLIILNIIGLVDYTAWAFVLFLNFLFSYAMRRAVHEIFDRAFGGEDAFRQYAEIFRLISETQWRGPLLTSLASKLSTDAGSAHHHVSRLDRLVALTEVRHSMAYPFLQAITLWDFHVLARLERWQRDGGGQARRWFSVAHEYDALAALATLKHDNPDWVFPESGDDGSPVLRATQLGHPLLPESTRVTNDVEIGPPHSFLMITGSNMSGKSTLLRAIGLNVVLGQVGGPVCASDMRMPTLHVTTSMQVHDSLEQGLSHFMAELKRLKQVIDQTRAAAGGQRTVLYLLDDILQGTNSAERQVAARGIIEGLLAEDAIGAVTTHDLTLAETAELSAAARTVHFSETIEDGPGGPKISFDYKLRPGIATSTNALKLLELMGLRSQTPGDGRGRRIR